jgi:uncharacterized membrane-anchored protein
MRDRDLRSPSKEAPMPSLSILRRLTREPLAAKVPGITAVFWLIKVVTTGAGEAFSDYLAHLDIVLAALVGAGGLAVGLTVQLRARRYRAPVYWSAVAMVAVFGTMLADGVHLIGLPYVATTAFYVVLTSAIFLYWWRSEGTLSIHSITTSHRELLYWSAVLATFALGTAAGDLAAATPQLGYPGSIVIFAVAIAIPALAWRFARLNAIVAFWLSYIFTRPLGASIADYFGKPASHYGGLGVGDGTVTLVAAVAIAGLVAYLSVRRTDIQPASPSSQNEATAIGV